MNTHQSRLHEPTRVTTSPRNNPRGVLAALVLATTVSALGMSIVNVALPAISAQFSIAVTTVQWATLPYLLTSTISVVLVGRLSDQYGRAQVLGIGIIIFIAAAIVAAAAPTFTVLAVARGIQGIGTAAMGALPIAVVRTVVSTERVGRAMGLLGSSMAAGMALGPAAGGLLVSVLDWRGVFGALAVLGIISLILTRTFLRLSAPLQATSQRFDTAGAALLVAALAIFSIALTLRPGGWTGALVLLAVALALAALFVVVEMRVIQPLVDVRMLHRAKLIPSFLLAFLAAYLMMTFTVVPPFYLTEGLGLSDAWMGAALAVGPLIAVLAGIPAGRIVDRSDARLVSVVGLALMTLAALAFVFLPAALGLIGFLIAAVILTPGNQLFMAGNNTATMMRAGDAQQGVVSGLLNLARNLGFTTGASAAALLYESASAAATPTTGLQAGFTAAAIIGLIAAAIALGTSRAAVGKLH